MKNSYLLKHLCSHIVEDWDIDPFSSTNPRRLLKTSTVTIQIVQKNKQFIL
jgi:hypothetical protein